MSYSQILERLGAMPDGELALHYRGALGLARDSRAPEDRHYWCDVCAACRYELGARGLVEVVCKAEVDFAAARWAAAEANRRELDRLNKRGSAP